MTAANARAAKRTHRLRKRPPSPRKHGAFLSTAHGATPASIAARHLRPGNRLSRPGADHREPPDHRRRAGLAGRDHRRKNHVLMRRVEKKARSAALGTEADPVMLEVFNNLFMSIAEQMGVTLQNTAYSVNIKERLDFSCAVFDAHRRAGRQRAAHAGASRLHGPLGRDHHPAERGRHPSRRRLRAQRPLQWRHASARHHRGDAGVRRLPRARRRSSSTSPRAAITPMSAARRRAR